MSGRNFIAGKWLAGGGDAIRSLNPATGEEVWQGKAATDKDVNRAFAAAGATFEDWSQRPPGERIEVLRAYAALLEAQKDEVARAISIDTGKPLWDALGEAGAMAAKVEISIRACDERTGSSDATSGALRTRLEHRPHGVMAVFGPYNFPGHLPNGHIVPALLAGNTIVFKPSSLTPLVADLMAGLWDEAGLPAGALNLLHGSRAMGDAILSEPRLAGLLVTGSVATGIALTKALAERPEVILALEMGGNNPLVYWGAEDVEAAAMLVIQSAYISSGQRCTCARRLVLPDGEVGDTLLEALIEAIGRIRVGAFDTLPEPFMGPLVSNGAAAVVLDAQRSLEEAGGKVICRVENAGPTPAFLSPGLIDVTGISERPDEEVFGPLLQVIRVDDLDEAIAEANNTRFGLAAGLISDDRAVYEKFHAAARAGIVNWNRPTTGASSAAPFGGVGLSGNHRPAAYYAADYCAWPVASQEDASGRVSAGEPPRGLNPGESGK
jgi:succinylglutamic semialdehyde dehydrogenase